jgi:hypothetical protein
VLGMEEEIELQMKMEFPYILGRLMSTGKHISKQLRNQLYIYIYKINGTAD